jgi:hypothetical protein
VRWQTDNRRRCCMSHSPLYRLVLVWMMSACISTELEPTRSTVSCARRIDPAVSLQGMVLVNDTSGSTPQVCTGLAITRTLVLTHSVCVQKDVEVDAGVQLVDGGAPACDTKTGSPREDGRFIEWTPPLADKRALQVFWRNPGGMSQRALVARVFTLGSASYCADALAVLELDTEFDVVALPLRLQEASRVGEQVSWDGLSPGSPPLRGMPSLIERITFESGDDTIPPRSLLLAGQACSNDLGGPVVSLETGAVIGVIATAYGGGCGDALGKTVALRLAPFRQFLAQSARKTRGALLAEAGTTMPSGAVIPECGP